MQFTIERDALLKPLQMVSGAIERRHTLPILSNVLIEAREDGQLILTGTDLEIELVAMSPYPATDQPRPYYCAGEKNSGYLPQLTRHLYIKCHSARR